jgi:hypothetical protein
VSECYAEFIDGTWDTSQCGCEDCTDAECEEIERQYELGEITYGKAIACHERVDLDTL